ncbi:MAG: pyruvate dehydrogenase (acetyl-transferring) E1 component subunit alpha [Chlamydiales bacterium]
MKRHFTSADPHAVAESLGKEQVIEALKKMLNIRNFEMRAESAYLQAKIGGFFHSYIGQEAIQTAAVMAMGKDNWWITTYRCHALALLLGATPNEIMSELYGRENGNAHGRGGSMHLYTDRLLGGFGIVGGQVPIATGAAFTIKYLNQNDRIAICFLGEGAMAQGAFHEALNMASLWDLPCLYVIENNQWGMGTHVNRAICIDALAEQTAPSYNMKGYTLDGMDFLQCYHVFLEIFEEIKRTQRPILVEAVTERFRGHSISDPGLYRTKDELAEKKQRDPIMLLQYFLEEKKWLDEEAFKKIDSEQRQIAIEAMKHADESPWPNPSTLEEGVFAPSKEEG